jgi:c-di-GMP-binding flagellar brake protein YcgR
LSEDFQLISHPGEAESHFSEAIRTRAAATVWNKDQKFRFTAHLFPLIRQNIADPANFQLATPFDFNTERLAKQMDQDKDRNLFLNVALSRANIFFKTPMLESRSDLLILKNPEKIFKVQRRKDMRLRIRDGYIVKVEFTDPINPKDIMNQKMFDLSAGGCSFAVAIDEVPIFVEGLVLKKFTFQIANRKIELDAEVKNKRPSSKNGYHYVGVQFKNVRAADTHHIAKYVFDENLKFLSRFL